MWTKCFCFYCFLLKADRWKTGFYLRKREVTAVALLEPVQWANKVFHVWICSSRAKDPAPASRQLAPRWRFHLGANTILRLLFSAHRCQREKNGKGNKQHPEAFPTQMSPDFLLNPRLHWAAWHIDWKLTIRKHHDIIVSLSSVCMCVPGLTHARPD